MIKSEAVLEGFVMRGITLNRPWPWAILHAGKRVENRGWPPPKWMIGQWLAIHAGKTFTPAAARHMAAGEIGGSLDDCRALRCPQSASDHPIGIVAVARLVGSVGADTMNIQQTGQASWAFGPHCWQFDDVRELPEPIPCRGQQGLWTLPLDIGVQIQQYLAFPIQWPYSDRAALEAAGCPRSVPWAAVAPFQRRALSSHGQTLERLADRGGLAVWELVALLRDAPFRSTINMPIEEAVTAINSLIAAQEET